MTRLAQTPAAARRFASSDSRPASQPDEKEPEFEEEGFNSPMWKYSLGAIGLMFLMGKYDDYVEQSGRVHPLTKFYASIMSDKEANRRVFTAYQQEVAKVAEFNIFQWEEYNSDVVRALDNAVYYKRSANWGTPVGSQVDMSGAHGRTPVRE
ncbi:hypothetical protein IWW55_003616 [Coemansia sp. RSA 2706]|nr:hypothetical protein IWW55_003616 [Coemansia sp. RSA 2706]KAJ2306597.1 hypothetical protein IWW54_004688 [Coemansia sp. RSA 2705]KAJ2313947.1 hypothetical protein IWW52_004420 [Coemansia sp. RSA 2704]KAJ2724468.1 hypothetical protein H4R23_004257 [Coemansia sp. Cherry 401B]